MLCLICDFFCPYLKISSVKPQRRTAKREKTNYVYCEKQEWLWSEERPHAPESFNLKMRNPMGCIYLVFIALRRQGKVTEMTKWSFVSNCNLSAKGHQEGCCLEINKVYIRTSICTSAFSFCSWLWPKERWGRELDLRIQAIQMIFNCSLVTYVHSLQVGKSLSISKRWLLYSLKAIQHLHSFKHAACTNLSPNLMNSPSELFSLALLNKHIKPGDAPG